MKPSPASGSSETPRVVGLGLLAFLLMMSYGIARPASESVFLQLHTEKGLPWAWLLEVGVITLVVALYNRLVASVDLMRLMGYASLASALAPALLLPAVALDLFGSAYLLYVWKDVYVVVLVEIFYSFANSSYPIRSARWLYGLFAAVGSLGGVLGNLAGKSLSAGPGTLAALWTVPGLLLVTGLFCFGFARRLGTVRPDPGERLPLRFSRAFQVVRSSAYLMLVLGVVALFQLLANLVDYEYNRYLYQAYPAMDVRTGITSSIYAVINGASLVMQLLAGPLLRLVGAPLTLLALPLLLAAGLSVFACLPRFLTAAVVKVAGKCFDYSLLRVGKEILYIPLDYAERTQGKSFADMLTHRTTKCGASLLILLLIAVELTRWITPALFGLTAAWFLCTLVAVRRFRRLVSREREMQGASTGE